MSEMFTRKTRRRSLSLLCTDCVVFLLLFMDFGDTIGLLGVEGASGGANVDEDSLEFNKDINDWAQSVFLDEAKGTNRIRLFWTPRTNDVLFRIEAPTKGYIGLGLSRNGRMAKSDMAVGWVKDGQAYLQDRHAPSRKEPKVDKKQDWYLIAGYENETHTSLILRRQYDTCDRQDIKITNDTLRILYAFHDDDPDPSNNHRLTYHSPSQRGVRSILLTQAQQKTFNHDSTQVYHWDLQSQQVSLPRDEDTLYWCKLFKLPNITTKHHMIGYEPIIQRRNHGYMHHVLLYACNSQGKDDDLKFEEQVRSNGHRCHYLNLLDIFKSCNVLMAVWAIGSKGLALPENIGYPLDPKHGPKYFRMEIHYDNPYLRRGIRDSSGIRIFYTPNLRRIEAGIFSVGIDPNWRHMIPPKQPSVVSYGHCIGECTKKTLPDDGIQGFAFLLHSHLIGRKIRLRRIRDGVELAPIIVDNHYDFDYQEHRVLTEPVTILPGDHLIAECTYNSKGRDGITIGGFSTREEMCLVFVYHYPKINLLQCHSIPTESTHHSSMGIDETWEGRIPLVIKKPKSLANLTLKEHLSTYDWSKNYRRYQNVIRSGGFEVICDKSDRRPQTVIGTHYFPNISKPYHAVDSCSGPANKPLETSTRTSNPRTTRRTTTTKTTTIKFLNSSARFGNTVADLKYGSIIVILLFCKNIFH